MPIEQLNQPLTFYAFYSASKQGVAGLTVTVDVYRVNTSAAATQVVTAGSATGVGGGLYLYQLSGGSVTVEGEYLCVFKTSSTSVDQQHIPAIWVVQKAGVEYLDAAITSRPSATDYTTARAAKLDNLDAAVTTRSTLTAANVWDYATASATTAGSLGKLLGDNLNATVSSRSTLTAANVWDYLTASATTSGSIGKRIADNLDVVVSTRTDAATWTATKAGYLDTAISSRSTLTAANVWDAATSGLTTAGSIGLRLATNVDATISSRGTSTLTAANVWDAATSGLSTAGSIGLRLATNVDTTISSRSTLTAANVWDYTIPTTPVVSSYGERLKTNLDATVSSRTDTTTWTATKAGYLDVAISSRSTLTAANVWDYLTSSATTAGSIGKRIADNLDATVSSRGTGTSTLTAANVWDYLAASATTAGSLGKRIADNLDTTVSSRGTGTSTLTAANVWDYAIPTTPVASSYGERIKTNLDATVSTRLASSSYTAPPTTANIWDYLTASATTAGSIGKRIADNLDAQVSTRLATSGYTAPDNTSIGTILTRTDVATSTRASAADYTSARAAKIDNLDAAITTRSTLTAANVWDYATASATTAGSLGKRIADNVDATISSRTDTATWTSTKAGYLDVAISSRLATTGYTAPDNTTITNIYARTDVATSTRSTLTAANVWDYATSAATTAGSLGKRIADNLDATISSITSGALTAASVWDYVIPATPVASSYGERVKTNLDATVSSRTDTSTWTATKAGYLDVAISSRLATAGYTAPDNATITNIYSRTDVATSTRSTLTAAQVWDYAVPTTPVASSYGERVKTNLDATVSSRTDSTVWTNTKAGYLDVAMSSRLSSAGYTAPDNASITTILGRVDVATSTRATNAGVWDYQTSAATTVGSLGKLMVDNLNATISSRLATAGYTAPDNTTISNIYARTDVATSTRSTLTAANVWDYTIPVTPVASSYGERVNTNLDATVSSRTDSATWTSTKAGYLDVAVSSRLATAGYTAPDNAGITTLTGRLTATRAGYLDNLTNLDATVSSRATVAGTWDALTSGLTTVGSVGKRIADYVDAAVTSRASAADYTSARAAKIDYLDATVSSRTDSTVWTNTKAGYIDAAVTSRATTAGVWDYATASISTAGSIGKVVTDNIDATISSRLAATAYTAPDNTTINNIYARTDVATSTRANGADWTATRAGKIDYLDASVSSRLAPAGITALSADVTSIKSVVDTNLNATVGSRLAASSYVLPDNATITSIYARTDVATSTRAAASDYTSARAAKLDYLDASISSIDDAVTVAGYALGQDPSTLVWSAMTAGLTTVGTIGKRISDNLDATITSRLTPAGITSMQADITAIKVPVVANVDATISSRLAAAAYTAPDNSTIASIYARTDVATSTRADGSQWTSTRAGKIDYLDATISSRLTPAEITSLSSDVTSIKGTVDANLNATITSRAAASDYTSARAAKIDYLDATISSRLTPAGITSMSADVTTILGRVDVNTSTRATVSGTWDALTSGMTTAGSIGKRISDNLDVTVSSRLAPAGITSMSADVSAIKTPVLAYVDATISSRATASALSSLQVDVTAAKAVIDSNLNATVSSRASAADWTSTRAAKIDYLDASVSSRATVSGTWAASTSSLTTAGSIGKRLADNVDVTVSSRADGADYTSARAIKIDNLDATVSSRSTVATVWDAATSGMITAGSIGKRISDNLDATITSRPAATDYTSARAIKLDYLDATITSRPAATDYTSARAVKLDYLDAPVSSLVPPGGITSLAANVSSIKTVVDANMDATISSRATVNGTWNALTAGMVTVGSVGMLLVDRIDAAISSRMAAGTAVSLASGSLDFNTYAPGQDPETVVWGTLLENINTNSSIGKLLKDRVPYLDTTVSSRLSAGVGSSIYSVTVTTDDEVTPISGASVWVTADYAGSNVIAGTLTTNGMGVTTFLLDPGSYYLWRQAEGWTFQNPVTITVA